MALRPEIFVSAVVPELNAYRKAVKHALLELGARPLEQSDFSIEYGPLHGVLSQLLSRCDAVIHLAGFHYGMEPAERTLHAPRRSFAQYEIDVARLMGKPIFVFLATEACRVEPHAWEDEEKRLLQSQHRSALERSGGYVKMFGSADELGRLVRTLRSQLIVRRSLAKLPGRPMGSRFIGRSRQIQELADQLAPGRLDVLIAPHTSTFTGGHGKTTLALEFGWRMHDDRKFDFVFWIPSGPRADLEVSLAALARTNALALLSDEVVGHKARFQAVLHWLDADEHTGRWLMIIDGVDDEIAWWSLRTLLPYLSKGAILLTGRQPSWPGAHEHIVATFSGEQAREFMAGRLEHGAPAAPAERQAWDRLAESLGRMPLALEVAAAFLREMKLTAREFLTAWTASHKLPAVSQGPTMVAMIEKSIEALDPPARMLLRTLGCLAAQPAGIPLALFEHRGDWPQTSASIAMLEHRSLVLSDQSAQTISVHRLIREIVRDQMSADQMLTALGAARAAVDTLLQRSAGSLGAEDSTVRELLIPHCRALMGQLIGHPLELHAASVARALGDWLKDCGRLSEAETFYRRALGIEERRLGPDHPDIAPRLRDLATILRSGRQLAEAEELYRRLIAIDQERQNPDLSALSADLTQFAGCLRAAGRLAEAEQIARQALEIAQQASGQEHPKVAIAMHHLAGVLEAAHRPREAENFYRRALNLEERAFGLSHPRLANRLYHLAHLLADTGRLGEAETLYRRALAIDEANHGPDHPDLAPGLDAFGALLEDAGQLKEAEKVFRRSLLLHERSVGEDHAETAMALTNLACVLEAQGQIDSSLPLYERAAAILSKQTRVMRGPHPHLRSALDNLSRILAAAGVPEEEILARIETYRPIIPRHVRSKFLDD